MRSEMMLGNSSFVLEAAGPGPAEADSTAAVAAGADMDSVARLEHEYQTEQLDEEEEAGRLAEAGRALAGSR